VTGFDPPKGWSERYVASIIKIQAGTVKAAIERLEKMDLLRREGSRWLVPKTLSPIQEDWFIKKNVALTEKVVLGEFEPDVRKMADRYLPGEIVGITEPVSSWRPIDSILVYGEIGRLFGSERSDQSTRDRIFADATTELSKIGMKGDDWKPIIERHVERHLTETREGSVPTMSDEELDRYIHDQEQPSAIIISQTVPEWPSRYNFCNANSPG